MIETVEQAQVASANTLTYFYVEDLNVTLTKCSKKQAFDILYFVIFRIYHMVPKNVSQTVN